MALCPECETALDIEEGEVEEGEIVSCAECGTDFEVITVVPLELNRISEEGEDEDDEDGDEDEDEENENGDY